MSQRIEYFNLGASTAANPEAPKRRMRTLRSCLMCRKRKTRCDKTKPVCSGCVKRNEAHLCQYIDGRWDIKIADTKPAESVAKEPSTYKPLKSEPSQSMFINETVTGANTQVSLEPLSSSSTSSTTTTAPSTTINSTTIIRTIPNGAFKQTTPPITSFENDIISFHQIPFPTPGSFIHVGTLSWSAITKKDMYVNITIASHNPKSALINTPIDQNSRTAQFFKMFEQDNPEIFNTNLLKRSIKCIDSGPQFVEALRGFLNDTELCWYLVDVFFDTELSIYLPFIDKLEFKSQLQRILGQKPGDMNLQITSDLSIIGLLILIMKQAHFYVTFNYGKENHKPSQDPKIKYIFEHPLKFDIQNIVNKIQKEIIDLKPFSINAFQFLLMKYYYYIYAPEKCACSNLPLTEQIGSLYKYATVLSLDRDPEKFMGFTSVKNNDLYRRLWYGLVLLDNMQYLVLGMPKVIDENLYDTELPRGFTDDELDSLRNNFIIRQLQYYSIISPILNLIVPIKNPPTYPKLINTIEILTPFIEKLKSINDLKIHDSIAERLNNFHEFQQYLYTQLLLFMVYHQLFIHFSMKQIKPLTVKYLLKAFDAMKNLIESISLICPSNDSQRNPKSLFGSGMFLFPLIENGAHKFAIFMMSILGRVKALKLLTMNDIPISISLRIDQIIIKSLQILETLWSNFLLISSTYFHLWKTSKMHNAVFKKCLNMPLGPSYNVEKTLVDINIITDLNKYKGYDLGFSFFEAEDFKLIEEKFENILNITNLMILNKNMNIDKRKNQIINSNININNNLIKQDNDSPSREMNPFSDFSYPTNNLLDFNDKRWFDKMLSEFSESNQSNQDLSAEDLINLNNHYFSTFGGNPISMINQTSININNNTNNNNTQSPASNNSSIQSNNQSTNTYQLGQLNNEKSWYSNDVIQSTNNMLNNGMNNGMGQF